MSTCTMYTDNYNLVEKCRYNILGTIGIGAFGEVKYAVDISSGREVAIKYIKVNQSIGVSRAVFREIESLRQLTTIALSSSCDYCYVTEFIDLFTDNSNICLVLEYLVSDLSVLLSKTTSYFGASSIKCMSNMILKGINHCHSNNIIHRDIKPSNIMISNNGQFKLADFGLARVIDTTSTLDKKKPLSSQVQTRWYRSPEMLYASSSYDKSIDMWSIGVVIAELIKLTPLFPGNNDIDQMSKVFQIMGSPTIDIWPNVDKLPDYGKVSFANMCPIPLEMVLPHADAGEISLISSMLQLDPTKRITSSGALSSSYFSSYPLSLHYSCLDLSAIAGKAANSSSSSKANPSSANKVIPGLINCQTIM